MPCNTSLSPNAKFNAIEFYIFASQLYTQYSNEAAYRTIVGRSYYAAFSCAKDYSQIVNSSGSIHNEIIQYFKVRDRKVWNFLKDLKELRRIADYELTKTVQKRDAAESLRLTRKILIALNYLP